jgi:RNA polymerase sigma-B factor
MLVTAALLPADVGTEPDRGILRLRCYGNQTRSEIGAQLGISQLHVSRLLAAALTKLRVGLAED